MRPAPGTWASALAVALGLGLHALGGFPLLFMALVVVTAAGFWACQRAFADQPGADPQEVVIDEVAGQWVALCFPSFAFWNMGLDGFPYPGWLAAFVFFRLFDIWKPWVIGWADQRGDPLGVMLDDLLAGLAAGVFVIIAAGVAHGVLM